MYRSLLYCCQSCEPLIASTHLLMYVAQHHGGALAAVPVGHEAGAHGRGARAGLPRGLLLQGAGLLRHLGQRPEVARP